MKESSLIKNDLTPVGDNIDPRKYVESFDGPFTKIYQVGKVLDHGTDRFVHWLADEIYFCPSVAKKRQNDLGPRTRDMHGHRDTVIRELQVK